MSSALGPSLEAEPHGPAHPLASVSERPHAGKEAAFPGNVIRKVVATHHVEGTDSDDDLLPRKQASSVAPVSHSSRKAHASSTSSQPHQDDSNSAVSSSRLTLASAAFDCLENPRASRICWNVAVLVMSLCFTVIGAQQLIFLLAGKAGSFSTSSPQISGGGTGGTHTLAVASPQKFPVEPPDRMIVVSGWSAAQSGDGGGEVGVASGAGIGTDISWLMYLFADHCIAVIDHQDPRGPEAKAHPFVGAPFAVRPNKGREASAFLQFIITHYDALPARMVFLHGQRTSWHNSGDLAVVIRHLNWNLDYANLNHRRDNAKEQGVTTKYRLGPQNVGGIPYRYDMISRVWPRFFAPYFGEIPPYFDIHASAQFLVSRDNVRAVPLKFWQDWQEYLLSDDGADRDFKVAADVSILYEHMWTFLMTRGQWKLDIDDDGDVELCKVLVPGACERVNDPATGRAVLVPPTTVEMNEGEHYGVQSRSDGQGTGKEVFYPCRGYPARSASRVLRRSLEYYSENIINDPGDASK